MKSGENPFEVLRLDPTATEAEIVAQAGRLRQRCTDEESLTAIRQAVQVLTTNAEERALWALLTHPKPEYASPALDQFITAFRRPPSSGSKETNEDRDTAIKELMEMTLELPTELFAQPLTAEVEDELRRCFAQREWKNLMMKMEVY